MRKKLKQYKARFLHWWNRGNVEIKDFNDDFFIVIKGVPEHERNKLSVRIISYEYEQPSSSLVGNKVSINHEVLPERINLHENKCYFKIFRFVANWGESIIEFPFILNRNIEYKSRLDDPPRNHSIKYLLLKSHADKKHESPKILLCISISKDAQRPAKHFFRLKIKHGFEQHLTNWQDREYVEVKGIYLNE
jgi:hypothetical protein